MSKERRIAVERLLRQCRNLSCLHDLAKILDNAAEDAEKPITAVVSEIEQLIKKSLRV